MTVSVSASPGDGASPPVRAAPLRPHVFSLAFVVVVAALAFVFHGGVSSNPASRALTVLGLTELGTLSADPWAKLTIDRAIVDGHTYSDKAPLSSFVVLPFYWVWHVVRGRPYAPHVDLKILVLLGDVFAAAIPFGAFVLLLQRRAARALSARATGGREAVLFALMAAFGTPLFSYGAIFFGHALGGALFVFAYDAAVRERARLAGFLAGLAVLAELPLALGCGLVGVYLLCRPRGAREADAPAARASGPKLLLQYVLGGLPCALALGLYNAAITGSPFDPPYHHLIEAFATDHPYVLDLHTFAVAGRLLFGQYRGLFFYAPELLLLAPLAFVKLETPARQALFAAVVLVQFGFIASFWMWDGGWCIGPRHLTGVIMIVLYEGVPALARTPRAQRPFLALAGLGIGINLIAVATNPFAPSEKPFSELYWPAFARGVMTPDNVFRMVGLELGRWGAYAWCALFVLAIVGLGALAEREAAATSTSEG
jgi:hypothetical protein